MLCSDGIHRKAKRVDDTSDSAQTSRSTPHSRLLPDLPFPVARVSTMLSPKTRKRLPRLDSFRRK